MQTAYLPVSLCDRIDRKIRNFIWGSSEAIRKVHNVNWQTVCMPKKLGGLGLRSARELNRAFLMKIAWGLISRPEELWSKVLMTKYLDPTRPGFVLRSKGGYSAVWRGILSVWNDMLNGTHWSIRDGKKTRFWTDIWLDSGVPLIDHALNIQGVNPSASVSDFCSSDGIWDRRQLENNLPLEMVLQVQGMTPPRQESGADLLVWGLENNGRFTIRSAYDLLKDHRTDARSNNWQKIWHWKGPNKIKHFMWLAAHGKLMTNMERMRRGIADQSTCEACGHVGEDINHVFRSCRVARDIWSMILPEVISANQLQWDFQNWWVMNIGNPNINPLFGFGAWLIWKRRNTLVFDRVAWSAEEVRNQSKFGVLLFSSSWKAGQVGREAPVLARQTHLIGWRPADEGWFSLNSDGSLYSSNNRAARVV
ncbi:Putative ribonuclease H protein At1g65750 [Linum perenne]